MEKNLLAMVFFNIISYNFHRNLETFHLSKNLFPMCWTTFTQTALYSIQKKVFITCQISKLLRRVDLINFNLMQSKMIKVFLWGTAILVSGGWTNRYSAFLTIGLLTLWPNSEITSWSKCQSLISHVYQNS